ncbi:MAG: ABC transporter ATP-binding protein [Burkholderiaceae bacterium]
MPAPDTMPDPIAAPAAGDPAQVPPVVDVAGLVKGFGSRRLLDGIDLRILPGETLALMGESGTGKSTLLNLLAGLEGFEAGRVRVLGQALDQGDPDRSARLRREHIGFVFQAFHLLPHLTVWQNVAIPLMLQAVPLAEARERVQQLLDAVGLREQAPAWPRNLSGGEQQRVALARALAHRPALVLADEPTGNLDPESARMAMGLLTRLVADHGAALLMVTHSEVAAGAMARVLLLRDGRITERDGPGPGG